MPFQLEDSLFADGSTLIGTEIELKTGREIAKRMSDLEEKCHDSKEESITFQSVADRAYRFVGTTVNPKL